MLRQSSAFKNTLFKTMHQIRYKKNNKTVKYSSEAQFIKNIQFMFFQDFLYMTLLWSEPDRQGPLLRIDSVRIRNGKYYYWRLAEIHQ